MNRRLLIVGTAYAIREHRKKLPFLAKRFDLTCATAREGGGLFWTETLEPQSSSGDFELIGLPVGGAAHTGTRSWYRGLGSVFCKRPYDLVFVENEPWGMLRWQCWLLKQRFQPRALFGEFTWENILRRGLKGQVLGIVYRLAAKTSDFAIGGNQEAMAILERFGTRPERTFCLPQFGVDPEIFIPLTESERVKRKQSMGFPPDASVVGFCGRFVSEKGVLDLLAAFETLPPLPAPIFLAFVGTGPLSATMESAARTDTCIRILPPVAYPEIATFLQLLDLLVLPSRTSAGPATWWREQFGHILIESMSCAVATLGSNCGAIPEVIGDPECIFPEGDVAALRELLQRALSDRPWRENKGVAARKRVLLHYTHEMLAQRYAEVFEPLI